MTVLAADAATTAGVVVGRLLLLVLGVYLLTTGLRRRRDPASPSRSTGRVVAGAVLLVLFLLNLVNVVATSTTPT